MRSIAWDKGHRGKKDQTQNREELRSYPWISLSKGSRVQDESSLDIHAECLFVVVDIKSPLITRVLWPPNLNPFSNVLEPAVPSALLLLERALDPSSRVVYGRLAANEYGCIVQKGAKDGARDGTAPRAPEPVR